MAKGRLTLVKLEERLNDWTQTHNERHVEEDKKLNLMLDLLHKHDNNHHSRRSGIKLTGIASAIAGVLAATALLLIQELSNWIPPLFP